MKKLSVLITCLSLIGTFNVNAQFGFVKKAAKSAKNRTVKSVKKVGSATKAVGKNVVKSAERTAQYGARRAKTASKVVRTVGKAGVRGAQNMVNSRTGKAIVRTVSAPGKSVYNATKVVRGKAGVGSIYQPYMEAAAGNIKVAARTATAPQRRVYRTVKKVVK